MFPTLAALHIKFLKTVEQQTRKTQKTSMSPTAKNQTYLPATPNDSPAKSRKELERTFLLALPGINLTYGYQISLSSFTSSPTFSSYTSRKWQPLLP